MSSRAFSILIPTWNGARRLEIVLRYYAEINITPSLIIDNKTEDRTTEVARKYHCPYVVSPNPTYRAQHIIAQGARALSSSWALRMDDDEVPTHGMMNYIEQLMRAPELTSDTVVGFPRFQCTIRNRAIVTSTRHTSVEHRQWRLFRPDSVRFTDRGHTPGFEVAGMRQLPAPDVAAMLHFDWVVRTPEERLEKIRRYDAHTANHGSQWSDYYLADTLQGFESELAPFDAPELRKFATELAREFQSKA